MRLAIENGRSSKIVISAHCPRLPATASGNVDARERGNTIYSSIYDFDEGEEERERTEKKKRERERETRKKSENNGAFANGLSAKTLRQEASERRDRRKGARVCRRGTGRREIDSLARVRAGQYIHWLRRPRRRAFARFLARALRRRS